MKLIDYLSFFNRKERFHLIGQLLGNASFNLPPSVLEKITRLLNVKICGEYFSAMDYHIDWIYASLVLTRDKNYLPKEIVPDTITATQEDVDFILVFKDEDNLTHIVMIEAKGDTYFTNKQIGKKAKRLMAIFGKEGNVWPNVKPHFLICSQNKPRLINTNNLPDFMLDNDNKSIIWFELPMPNNQLKVTRCNQNGLQDKNGIYWKIESRRKTEI